MEYSFVKAVVRRPQFADGRPQKNTRPTALCVGAVPSLFGPSGADQRKAQDGCQNGQLWLGVPLVRFDHSLFKHNGRLLRAAAIVTSGGSLEARLFF